MPPFAPASGTTALAFCHDLSTAPSQMAERAPGTRFALCA
jgi:hypothetical protein